MTDTTHLLGKYRGFGLFYDENEDVFFSDLQDKYELKKEPRRGALKDLKKAIDETIKANLQFEPFEAYHASLDWGTKKEKRIASEVPTIVTIKGIRKDGVLLIEKSKNTRHHSEQLHGDDRRELFVKDAKSEAIGGEIAIIEAEIDTLRKKKDDLLKKYKPLDLSFIEDFIKK